jgi:hypothetical protein
MVPVRFQAKVPEVAEVKVTAALTVPEPEASTNLPVPPVTVKEPFSWNAPGVEVGQIVS